MFQPILNNSTNIVDKYESLVRIIDENENVISPYYFLILQNTQNSIHSLQKEYLRKVCKYINFTDKSISINITAEDILNKVQKISS